MCDQKCSTSKNNFPWIHSIVSINVNMRCNLLNYCAPSKIGHKIWLTSTLEIHSLIWSARICCDNALVDSGHSYCVMILYSFIIFYPRSILIHFYSNNNNNDNSNSIKSHKDRGFFVCAPNNILAILLNITHQEHFHSPWHPRTVPPHGSLHVLPGAWRSTCHPCGRCWAETHFHRLRHCCYPHSGCCSWCCWFWWWLKWW